MSTQVLIKSVSIRDANCTLSVWLNAWKKHWKMVHITAGLSYDTNEPVLKNEFEKYGEVLHGMITMKSISLL